MLPFNIKRFTVEPSESQTPTVDGGSVSPSQLSTGSGVRTPSPDSSTASISSASRSQTSSADPDVSKALQLLEEQAARQTGNGREKPPLSFITLISMAILSVPERKLLLKDIYKYIMDNFDYYNNDAKAWRNSVRHNLSLNECFIKDGRAEGAGYYWSIHPACVEDFQRGDYRRRRARRRAKDSTAKAVNACSQRLENPPVQWVSPLAPFGYFTMYTSPRFSPLAQPITAPVMRDHFAPNMYTSPLPSHTSYPGFPLTNAMMTPFSLGHTPFTPWL